MQMWGRVGAPHVVEEPPLGGRRPLGSLGWPELGPSPSCNSAGVPAAGMQETTKKEKKRSTNAPNEYPPNRNCEITAKSQLC